MKQKLWLVCLITLAGCATPGKQTILKSYKKLHPSASIPPANVGNFVTFSSQAFLKKAEAQKDTPKSIFDLQGHGQEALIGAYAQKAGSNEDMAKCMNLTYLEKNTKPKTVDLIVKNLNLVFSVNKNTLSIFNQLNKKSPQSIHDRIEYLKITVQISDPANDITITGWDKFTTQYGTVDVGALAFKKTQYAEIAPSISAGAGVAESSTTPSIELSAGVSGKVSSSKEYSESQTLKSRHIEIMGTLEPHADKMTIVAEGTSEKDLEGNLSCDVTVKLKALPLYIFSFSDLKSGSTYKPINGITLNETLYQIPSVLPGAVSATVTLEFAYRSILKNAATEPEFDDHVKYYTGQISDSANIMLNADDLQTDTWHIELQNAAGVSQYTLAISSNTGAGNTDLRFIDLKDAQAFYDWLFNSHLKGASPNTVIGGREIMLRQSCGATTQPLNAANITGFIPSVVHLKK